MKLPLIIVMMMVSLASFPASTFGGKPRKPDLDALLIQAYEQDDTVALRKLIKAGANPYAPDQHGLSVLEWAFMRKPHLFDFLFRNGVRITRKTPNGTSLLHLAAYDEPDFLPPPELLRKVLPTLLASKNDVQAVSGAGATPLHRCAFYGKVELAKLLIAHGADINARDTFDATPLHYAGRTNLAPKDYLTCGSGAEYERRKEKESRPGRVAIAQHLMDLGANVNAVDHHQNLPLHWYYFEDCDTILNVALQHGLRVRDTNRNGETLLQTFAKCMSDGSGIAALINAGLDINKRDRFGRTPVNIAVDYGRFPALKQLLAAGADITIPDEDGNTPYSNAVRLKRTEILALLRGEAEKKDIVIETPPSPKTEMDQAMEEIRALRKK